MAAMAFQKIEHGARGFLTDFWKFAAKGNIFDLAVGVVLGTAFGAIVNSLVADILTPLLGILTNNVNLAELSYAVRAEALGSPGVVFRYGHLIQVTLNFLIVALSIYLFVKLFARLRKRVVREEVAGDSASLSTEEKLLTEIRDVLRLSDSVQRNHCKKPFQCLLV